MIPDKIKAKFSWIFTLFILFLNLFSLICDNKQLKRFDQLVLIICQLTIDLIVIHSELWEIWR